MSHYPRVIIDLAALKHNLHRVRQYAPHSRVMSVIKADAYGHGVLPVAQALADSDAFAVARLAEAVLLREHGITHPITVLEGFADADALHSMAVHQLIPVIHQPEHLRWLQTEKLPRALPFCWLMLETGMHRLGLSADKVLAAIHPLQTDKQRLSGLGLMSHFANSDRYQDARNQAQIAVMAEMAEMTNLPVCLANSAAVINLPTSHADWVRPGLMLYGVSPFEDKTGRDFGLKPTMQVQSRLIAINPLQPGDQVGYGGQWTARHAGRMGVVSMGYGDGFSRHLSNAGAVEIQGQICPVIGRVSMDTICIDLSACAAASLGDEVIVWGSSQLAVEWQAQQAGTIPYELMTGLTSRVTRVYRHGEN